MGEKSPDIRKRLNIKKTYVAHLTRGGFLRPISKDTKNKDGGAPCYVSMDEYHAHPTSEIHDRMMSGFGKRSQSLMDIISTAGDNAVNNPCKREYDLCLKILEGEIPAEDYFIMIRQLDEIKGKAGGLSLSGLADTEGLMGTMARRGGGLQMKVRGLRELLGSLKINYEAAMRSATTPEAAGPAAGPSGGA
jgi:hypothetical protein